MSPNAVAEGKRNPNVGHRYGQSLPLVPATTFPLSLSLIITIHTFSSSSIALIQIAQSQIHNKIRLLSLAA
ncbi:hypothetical protein QVD17_13763 [Tagetes erecta]|uniref:Uncharacterized protein n=1 Tax=Tagetes erecta TaxID=13708 RepID=A0AAD8KW68_TARER|nr:hypothetical protein QVD17_13763 [Tagetes erecta]